MAKVTIVGGGLAGSEAALQLAARGISVELIEMRPASSTPAHSTNQFAELVCSNSLKSLDGTSAAGTLKYELARMGSFLIRVALQSRVPAGKALAVDRDRFSSQITDMIMSNPLIDVVTDEISQIPSAPAIIATGPLTSDTLASNIQSVLGADFLSFYDAAAPIVAADSLDRSKIFAQSRYNKGTGDDYLNAAMDKSQYEEFVAELVGAQKALSRNFEKKELFSACQPVEEIARSGPDALRFGPLKPVGLTDPNTGKRPWAVVQLRAENASLGAYNLVGFQTNLKFGEQERVFRMIPGLENADFLRYGVMHRNTFINAPHALGSSFDIPGRPGIRFAGQITGTEGYCEAMASGLLSALFMYAELSGIEMPPMPKETLFGALVSYATDPATDSYQPMHVNYGIVPPLDKRPRKKQDRYRAYSARARGAIDLYRAKLEDLNLIPPSLNPEIPREMLIDCFHSNPSCVLGF